MRTTALFFIITISVLAQSKAQGTFFDVTLIDLKTNEAVSFNNIYEEYSLDSSKPTFVITWSGKWCFPCINLINRYNECTPEDINLITINVDQEDDREEVLDAGHQDSWNNAVNFHAALGADYAGFDNVFNVSSAPLFMVFKNKSLDIALINYSMYPYRMVEYGLFEVSTIWNSSADLNSISWDVYESDGSEVLYEDAIKWISRSIELDENYHNVDTHAALLFKTGEYTLALKEAKRAIEIAKANDVDYESTNELIQKIIDKL